MRIGRRVTEFMVQVELFWREEWRPVVRFDTAHGSAHRDLISPTGQVDKKALFLHSFNEALDYAETDLRQNWKSYVEQFLKQAGEK